MGIPEYQKPLTQKAFPQELMRKRWSEKEILTAIAKDIETRNGRLAQAIVDLIIKKKGGNKQ